MNVVLGAVLAVMTMVVQDGVAGPAGANDDAPAEFVDILERHPRGYLLIVDKARRRLSLALDGELVETVQVRKSLLDRRFFGSLEGQPEDDTEIRFPVPAAVSDRLGHRTYRYDRKTPEGEYRICNHHDRAHTNHTVAMSINFPNESDLSDALARRRISKKEYDVQMARLKRGLCPTPDTYLGGWIRIHGPSDQQVKEWRNDGVKSCPGDPPDDSQCAELAFEDYLVNDHAEIGVVVPGRFTKGCVVLELTPLFYLYQTLPVGTPVVILP